MLSLLDDPAYFFDNISLLFWSICYVLIAIKGFKEKTYGMPYIAMVLNISWEILRIPFGSMLSISSLYYSVWFICDIPVVITFFKYALNYVDKKHLKYSPEKIYTYAVLGLLTGFTVYALLFRFVSHAYMYCAFGQNLIMSALFIRFILKRGNLRGQSIWIALCKLIGTAAAIPGNYFQMNNKITVVIGSICVVLDAIYLVLVIYYKRNSTFQVKEKRKPIIR